MNGTKRTNTPFDAKVSHVFIVLNDRILLHGWNGFDYFEELFTSRLLS